MHLLKEAHHPVSLLHADLASGYSTDHTKKESHTQSFSKLMQQSDWQQLLRNNLHLQEEDTAIRTSEQLLSHTISEVAPTSKHSFLPGRDQTEAPQAGK